MMSHNNKQTIVIALCSIIGTFAVPVSSNQSKTKNAEYFYNRAPASTLLTDPTDPTDPKKKKKKNVTETSARDGGNVGGSPGRNAIDATSSWCRGNLSTLERFRQKANEAMLDSNFSLAVNELHRGLDEAMRKSTAQSKNYTVSHKAIERALNISNTLAKVLATRANGPQIHVDSLLSIYDLIAFVANEIDAPSNDQGWVAYSYGANIPLDVIEVRYAEYARKQLEWVMSNYLKKVRNSVTVTMIGGKPVTTDNGEAVFTTKYSSDVYLTVLEFVTKYAMEDLNHSLFNKRYDCVIESLDYINQDLTEFNTDSTSTVFSGDNTRAVNSTYRSLINAIHKINTKCIY